MSVTRHLRQALTRRLKSRRFRRPWIESLESRRVLSTVTFDADPSIAEGDNGTQALVFTVRRSANDGAETVEFSLGNDGAMRPATPGVDFQNVAGQLDFNGGADLVDTISVPIIGDTIVELDETFFVDLANPTGGLIIGDDEAIGTITNDDTATVSVMALALDEGDAGPTAFDFSVTLSGDVDVPFSLDANTFELSNQATAGIDFTTTLATLNFDGNDGDQQTFTVQVTGDTEIEPDELFGVNLNTPQASGRVINVSNGLGTITNDDGMSLGIDLQAGSDSGVSDTDNITNVANMVFDVSGVTPGVRVTVLSFDTVIGSADATTSTVEVPTNILLAGGDGVHAISAIETIDDVDGNTTPESLLVTYDATGPVFTSMSPTAPLPAGVPFSYDAQTDDETNAVAAYLRVDPTTGVPLVSGPGDPVVDPDNGTLTWTPTLNDVGTHEEAIRATDVAGNSTTQSFTLEVVNPSLTVSSVAIAEGDNGDTAFEFTVLLSGQLPSPFSVDIATAELPAGGAADVDFTANSTTLNFAGNHGEQMTFSVQVTGENLVEADELFAVNLSNVQADSTIELNHGMGTIINDDGAVVSVSGASVNEALEMVDFTVTLSNPVDMPVTVEFSTVDGLATAGSDFTAITNQQVTFSPGSTSETVTVTVIDDAVVERNETLQSALSNLMADERNVMLSTEPASPATILNDDSATLAVTSLAQNEGDADSTPFMFEVTLTGAVDTEIMVDIATAAIGGGATSDVDFTATSTTLNFDGTDGQQQVFTVQVNGEQLVETDEMFGVELSNLQANGRLITFANGTGTITNDDITTLTIEAAEVSVPEGDSGTTSVAYTVTSSHAVVGGFRVALNSSGTEADDFNLSANSLQFAGDVAGEQQTFNLNVVGDLLVELDQTVTITLGDVSETANGIDPGAIATGAMASTAIINDDLATVTIENVAMAEGNGPGTTAFDFTVSIDNTASHDITVVANTVAMEAIGGGTDFADVVDQTVTIVAGATSATLTVNVTGENLVELAETFQVNLTDARFNGQADSTRAIASGNPGTGTISNDDAATLSIADVSLAEGDNGQTAFQFALTLTNPVDVDVTVNATTSDGTATAGIDYTALTGLPVTVISPNTAGMVTVQIRGETLFEANETLNVALSNLAAGGRSVTLADAQAVGTIQNDDSRIAGFAYLDSNANGQRDDGEAGLAGVLITVTRTDVLGVTPTREILTDLSGRYVFQDQPAGTYTVTQRQPLAMVDGQETIGSGASGPGTAATNDTFQQIVLAPGEDGQGYNFGELRPVTPVSMRWYLASSATLPLLLRERIANVEALAGNTELAARIRAGEAIETIVAAAAPAAGEGEEIAAASSGESVVDQPPQAEAEAVVLPSDPAVNTVPSDVAEPTDLPTVPTGDSNAGSEVILVPGAASPPAGVIYGPVPPNRGTLPSVLELPTSAPPPEVLAEGEAKNCTLGPRQPADAEDAAADQPSAAIAAAASGQSAGQVPLPSVTTIDQALLEVSDWRGFVGPLPRRWLPPKI